MCKNICQPVSFSPRQRFSLINKWSLKSLVPKWGSEIRKEFNSPSPMLWCNWLAPNYHIELHISFSNVKV